MALLGILIIEKNGSNYLKLILDNLTSLSNFNWSLIDIYFYDDNSTDDSVKILNEIKKTLPIKVISGKYNDGLMHARLELMKICNDDFIILMDVDDTLSKNTFSAFLNSYKNHDLLMLKRKYIGSNHEKVFSNSYNENKSFLDNILTNVRLQFITGMFLKRNIYKEIVKILEKKDIHNIFIAEDITPNLIAISLAKEPCFLDAYYNYFLTNSSSITNWSTREADKLKWNKRSYENNKKVFYLIQEIIKNNEIKGEVANSLAFISSIRLLFSMRISTNQDDEKTAVKKISMEYFSNGYKCKLCWQDWIRKKIINNDFFMKLYLFVEQSIKSKNKIF